MTDTVRCQWLTDPRDGLTHAWRHVVEGGQWRALCGLEADPGTLTDPEDEYGHHIVCALAVGAELADRQGDTSWRP